MRLQVVDKAEDAKAVLGVECRVKSLKRVIRQARLSLVSKPILAISPQDTMHRPL